MTYADRKLRLLSVVLAVAVGAVGCTGPGSSPGPDGASAAATAQAGLVKLDVFTTEHLKATRVVPEVGGDRQFDVRGNDIAVLSAGGTLLSFTTDRDVRDHQLVASTDLGKTWRNVSLPGAPATGGYLTLDDAGGVTVASNTVAGKNYAWASTDGSMWRGGALPPGSDGNVDAPHRQPDGRLAMVVRQSPASSRVLFSADDGASWQLTDCPSAFLVAAPHRGCTVIVPEGGKLWVRESEVSLDAGRTWQQATVTPDPGSSIVPMVAGAVSLPGGGWLGVVNVIRARDSSFNGYLTRSTDGVHWQQVVANPCDDADKGSARLSTPQPLGERWLVAYTCVTNDDTPRRTQLYLVDHDGTRAKLLTTVQQRGASFGPPVMLNGTLVIPEIQGNGDLGGTISFIHLTA